MAASFRLSETMRWCIRAVIVVALFSLAIEVIHTIHLRNLARALANNGGSVYVSYRLPRICERLLDETDVYVQPRSPEAWGIQFGSRLESVSFSPKITVEAVQRLRTYTTLEWLSACQADISPELAQALCEINSRFKLCLVDCRIDPEAFAILQSAGNIRPLTIQKTGH
ncbi:MAG: hypothetical protein KF777_15965 [Planctomycetaceae bacterium]|nr:hypothetical protein [Planctomycetaceae bacterium]